MKIKAAWFLLVLLAVLVTASAALAVEEDENGNIRQSETLMLEGDTPPPPPKPKVIVKERVVMQCAPGTVWSPKNKRCISEDGEVPPPPQYTPAPPQAPRDDRYVYPRTKVRVRPGQCIMTGESMVCDVTYINTQSGSTQVHIGNLKNATVVDNLGNSFHATSAMCRPHGSCWVDYGRDIKHTYNFTFLDPRATSVTLTILLSGNGQTDLIKFVNVPVVK